MTSRLPAKRFIDVLNINRSAGQRKQQLASAMADIPPEILQTRFLRNRYLIDPKALCLLVGDNPAEDRLLRHHVFAIYKPPFCPMRRSDAGGNFHHVSVESFLDAALRSKAVYPALTDLAMQSGAQVNSDAIAKGDKESAGIHLYETLQTQRLSEMQKKENRKNAAAAAAAGEASTQPGAEAAHPGIHVRVLFDLDMYASGPVVVSLTDANRFARSLEGVVMHYDVLVAGHLPLKGEEEITNIEDLYGKEAQTSAVKTRCCWEATSVGFYAVHAVTVLRVSIFSPPSTSPPRIAEFVRKRLGTVVMGDATQMGELEAGNEVPSSTAAASSAPSVTNPLNLSMDCDFSREFTHLRYVSVEADEYSSTLSGRNTPTGESKTRTLEFQCRKCFDSIIKKERVYNLKARKMGLLDGSWNPSTELIG